MKLLKLYLPAFLILMIISGSISGQTKDFLDRPISKKTTSANIDKSKIKTKQFDSHEKAPGKEQTTEKRLETQPAITLPKSGNGIPGPTDDLCIPVYTSGCSSGGAIYSFAVEEIQNFGSFCANNTGYPGWSEYYDLGPAILFPGMIHTFTISIGPSIGYDDYWVDIWIDFNDDLVLTDDELILDDFNITQIAVLHDIDIAIPLDATPGLHVMRVRVRWHLQVTDPCASYSVGEAEDYYISIGTSDFGILEGNVTKFTGGAPVEDALISVNNGMHTTMTGPDGGYVIDSVFLGDWSVACTHDSYNPVSGTVIIIVDDTTQQNFSLTAPTLEIDSLDIFVNIDISSTTTEYVTISNNGDGQLHWSANIINNKGKAFLGPESTAFAYNSDMTGFYPEGPIYFSLNDPTNVTAFGSPVSGTIVTAEWVNETWYGIVSSGFLVTMDTTTGEFSTIGTSPVLTGMAFDWTQVVMYGVDNDGNLYTINLETGAGTIVASTVESITALACNNNGILYGFNGQWNTFGKINKNTGHFSWIGSIGFDITGLQDANVDHETNTIYWSFYNSTNGGELYSVDAATGSPSLIGEFPDNISVTALAIPGSPSGWISINTVFGNIAPGDDYQFAINLDAMNYIPGDTLEADIHFTSVPDVGDQYVHVTMTIGTEEWGNIEGTITLGGSAPYNIGDITQVEVTADPYSASPDNSGNYSIEVYPGNYDITAYLYGYETQTIEDITVNAGGQVDSVDFIMPCINGMISGTVTNAIGGAPIEDATVKVIGTDLETITTADGSYSLIVEAGIYNLEVTATYYMSQTAYGVIVTDEFTITQNFQLDESEGTIVVFDLDPTPNPEIVSVIEYNKPGYLVEYVTDIIAYPLNDQVETVFLLLGVFPFNHVLMENESSVITAWIDTYGGNLYMEGGATWYFNPPTTLHSYFNINGVSFGFEDLYYVNGINGPWANYSWSYNGENYLIDYIVAIPPAINVLENPTYGYYTGVAYAAGNYKTVGTSHEVTGLNYGYFWDAISCIFTFFDFWQPSFGSIEGYVTETDTGNPVEGALVSVGTQGSDETDTTGYYFIEYILSGNYIASCSKEGYNYVSTPVTILQDDTTTLDFQLEAPGSLEGMVTDIVSGAPIADATIDVGDGLYTTSTGSDGTYSFDEILAGEWTVHCEAVGYSSATDTVTILSNQISELNFELGGPDFIVEPSSLEIFMNLNETLDTFLLLSNPGYISVNWTADLIFPESNNTDDLFDLQFAWPNAVGGGEAGIETNGNYIYTTKWNGDGQFYRYDMDGNYLGEFTISVIYGLRDLTYDGTYFYGGTGLTTVYEMDLDNEIVISQFTAPTEVRAIAYNEVEEIFYANNWDTDITAFNYNGQYLGSFPTGPFGSSYYGFAYDIYSPVSPFLWGYSQAGSTPDDQNWLVQIELPSGEETGVTFNVATVVPPISGIAGGLCISNELVNYSWTIMGNMQNEYIWGVKLIPFSNWIMLDLWNDTLAAGDSVLYYVHLNTSDILPGSYTADIIFTTDPDTGPHVVHVFLNVISLEPPVNFSTSFDCVETELCWDMPPNCYPDSFSVYCNGQLITNTTNYCYTFAGPGYYECYITAWYSGQQSAPSDIIMFEIPWPADAEPANFAIDTLINNIVYTSWDEPPGCAEPDGYNVYRDGIKLNDSIILQTFYPDTFAPLPGVYEYYATTVYFFGESDPSNIDLLVITYIDEVKNRSIQIYPVPASDYVNIKSTYVLKNIRVLNNIGQIVIDKKVNIRNYKINVSKYESGIYYIKLETEGRIIIRKIVVE